MKLLLLLSFGFAAFNTGLIWIVQLVHYPGFLRIGKDEYDAYQAFHMRNITYIVAPSMFLEMAFSSLALIYLGQSNSTILYLLSFGLLILIFVNTAFWAAPTHTKLLTGFDPALIKKLISVNWWRTIAWSARAMILGYLLYKL